MSGIWDVIIEAEFNLGSASMFTERPDRMGRGRFFNDTANSAIHEDPAPNITICVSGRQYGRGDPPPLIRSHVHELATYQIGTSNHEDPQRYLFSDFTHTATELAITVMNSGDTWRAVAIVKARLPAWSGSEVLSRLGLTCHSGSSPPAN
ncbi:hypothetical protein NEOLEDRAFT_1150839 [Neolentinus lepideus HHB14362 ss-1]|uniref:Uncharacterized protein n=1 Tax=Neolentinus lepideus HHB14362 ss-1 TaxID=1314782 RepID=A0A165PJW5_9AGAM|nr:hypothetical protein NEOLEDRAFT_1150839 [Neolentinus lepideus HHB14362 ss-1]